MVHPGVTVLCSNYNSLDWITGYCHSLDLQLLPEFTIVFVDAKSSDNSLDFFRSFSFRDGISVKIIECKERITVYGAWNIGIEMAETEYCINVNTDDRLFPAALQTMLSYATANPDADVLYSSCIVCNDPAHAHFSELLNWPEFSHSALINMCICGPFPLIRREAIRKAGMFDPGYRVAGDYEMWLRMSKLGNTFLKVPEVIGSYFRNPAGLSTSPEMAERRYNEVRRARLLHA